MVLTALVIITAFVVLGGSAVIGLKLVGHKPAGNASPVHPSVSTGPSSPVVPTSPSTVLSSSAWLPPRQQAAMALVALLAQSGADRTSVLQAVTAAMNCSNLSQDETVFRNAESSRQSLLAKLAVLPSAAYLPATMLQHLTAAWQESSQADQDYAKWAQDAAAPHGCRPGSSYATDPHFETSAGHAQKASADKEAFAGQWSSIAREYHLQNYKAEQI